MANASRRPTSSETVRICALTRDLAAEVDQPSPGVARLYRLAPGSASHSHVRRYCSVPILLGRVCERTPGDSRLLWHVPPSLEFGVADSPPPNSLVGIAMCPWISGSIAIFTTRSATSWVPYDQPTAGFTNRYLEERRDWRYRVRVELSGRLGGVCRRGFWRCELPDQLDGLGRQRRGLGCRRRRCRTGCG